MSPRPQTYNCIEARGFEGQDTSLSLNCSYMGIVAREHLKRLAGDIHTTHIIPIGSKFLAQQASTAPQIQYLYAVCPVIENGLDYFTHGIGMYGMRDKKIIIKR